MGLDDVVGNTADRRVTTICIIFSLCTWQRIYTGFRNMWDTEGFLQLDRVLYYNCPNYFITVLQ
jgi:hypothetical protein